jgi:hypothetical protein
MFSVSALVGFILVGNEFSSSFEDPPKVKTGFFFFICCVGCKLLSIEFVCSLIESSPEDPPSANIPCFFGAGPFVELAATISAVGMEEGAERRGMDLYDELTCEGEKPLTTLVVLLSEAPLAESEEAGCAECSDVLSEAKDSTMEGVGIVVSAAGSGMFSGSGARYEWVLKGRGSNFFFSLISMTIFSRSSGVMWRSRPRLRL